MTAGGVKVRRLQDRMQAAPHRFDALQAMRLIELGALRLGTAAAPGEEPARVTAQQGLVFAPAPLAAIRADGTGVTAVRTAFLGLTGPLGVLPQVYSELVARADRLRNRAVAAFLDVFNHRLTSLFLRASEKYRLGLQVQRSVTPPPGSDSPAGPGTDPVSRAMLAVAGFGTPHITNRMAVADEVVLYYAGLFSARTRPAVALEAMLADYLSLPVRIEQFSGRWLPIDPGEQTSLTGGDAPFTRLGVDAVAGGKVWDPQAAFRIVVGPVGRADMLALMPTRPLLHRLADLVRAYAGPDLAFDVQVILRREDVPELQLGTAAGAMAPQLGWNTWAKGLPALQDKTDIILDLDRLPPLATKDRL